MKISIYLLILAILLLLYIQNVRFLLVTSNSMQPMIVIGDIIVTCKSRYLEGMIITFWQSGTLVTHRLVNTQPLTTKGDSNNHNDPHALSEESIIGKVCTVIPTGKLLLLSRSLLHTFNRKEVKK